MRARGGNQCPPLLHTINKYEVTVTPSEKKADNLLMVEWVYKATQSHECCHPHIQVKQNHSRTLVVRAPTKVLQKNFLECKSDILNSKVKCSFKCFQMF